MKKLSVINKQFIEAAQSNQINELKNLLDQVADINADGGAALRWFSRYGHLEIVKFLVTQGSNIHVYSGVVLRLASIQGHLETVKFLIDRGRYPC